MKCTKVRNPCKICFQAVSRKNGLQCQGACRKWAHFKCLNYTPGKIQDIKAGIIKVTCPCPDCNTFEPKEVLADPPFTCTNTKCPANKLPVCESLECPSKDSPIPIYPAPPFESYDTTPVCTPCPQPPPPPCATPKPCPQIPRCPSVSEYITNSSPQPKYTPRYPPRSSPPPPKFPTQTRSPAISTSPKPLKCDSPPPNCESPSPSSTPLGCPNPHHCPPPCCPVCPPTCPSYQNVKHQKKCCSPKQSQSCSDVSRNSKSSGKQEVERMRAISSDTQVANTGYGASKEDQKLLYSAIENLCNTVGQLSTQLRDLLCKMQQSYK